MPRRSRRALAATAAVCAAALAATLAGAGTPASGAVGVACGAATATTLSSIDSAIAGNIYRGELGGSETRLDIGHVTTAPDLLAAVAADNRAATLTAVKGLVYHSFWHIVRLRVVDAAGNVLADFGGPYVIAPVPGTLRSAGKVIGSFVLSVQDDVGFAKLEKRVVGNPIAIYVGGQRVTELGGNFPLAQPSAASLTLGGAAYGLVPLTFNAFPTGTLVASMAVQTPSPTFAAQSCAAVSLAETERVVKRIATRFAPLAASYGKFVETVHADTGSIVVVRIGFRAIAGSEGPGPPALPESGSVSYEGRTWSVFSFAPTPPARIFVLVPQAPPA